MARKAIALTIIALVASIFTGCDKAPRGVIPESDMVHVLADFAKADCLISQFPNKFPNDSSKMALKQSILDKYDANIEMYDSSLVWYSKNLKLYTELHDKAVALLEKEGNIKHDSKNSNNIWLDNAARTVANAGEQVRRVFPTDGDSANIWTEQQQWILTSALRNGYITFDFKPDREYKPGDMYSLNLKAINSSQNSIKLLLAIDYLDGTTSYVNRTVNINGWSNFDIQADSMRTVKRIYGFLQYNIKPMQVSFIDSIYMLRTHLDPAIYNRISTQRIAGPKAALSKESDNVNQQEVNQPLPGRLPHDVGGPAKPLPRNDDSISSPKPGLSKHVIPSNRRLRVPNPNGDHTPKPPIR